MDNFFEFEENSEDYLEKKIEDTIDKLLIATTFDEARDILHELFDDAYEHGYQDSIVDDLLRKLNDLGIIGE